MQISRWNLDPKPQLLTNKIIPANQPINPSRCLPRVFSPVDHDNDGSKYNKEEILPQMRSVKPFEVYHTT